MRGFVQAGLDLRTDLREMSRQRYVCLPQTLPMDGEFALDSVGDIHIESIRQWRNAQMDVLRQEAPITQVAQQRYFETRIWPTLETPQPDNVLLVLLHQGRAIGYGGLVHIAWAHRRAEVSFLLAPELTLEEDTYARYFSCYLGLIKRLAFESLGMRRLFTETYAGRVHHMGVLESAGFRVEGRLREHVLIAGVPVDSVFHGILRNEG